MLTRFKELDSLRGLAALSVLIEHLLIVIPVVDASTWGQKKYNWLNYIKYTPLHVFWAGDEAVIFFFVLSGFVLSLPFYSSPPSYLQFIIKRVCRIYIPYIAAIALGFLALEVSYHGPITGLSPWFNTIWSLPITAKTFIDHILLIGPLQVNAVDPPIWSLRQEMRISLVFPLIMILIERLKWVWSLMFGIALTVLSFRHGMHTPPGTFNYLLYFIMGSLLAKHRFSLSLLIDKRRRLLRIVLAICAVLLYTFRWWTFGFQALRIPILDYCIVSIGVCIFIILTVSTTPKWLLVKPIQFLGRISYSLYLIHMIIITSLIHTLSGLIPLWIILILAFFISICSAFIGYYLIELPSINLGRNWVKRISNRQQVLVSPYVDVAPTHKDPHFTPEKAHQINRHD